MNGADAISLSLLVIRVGLGLVFVAHGYNHIFGGGKTAGTARWFESLGILHAGPPASPNSGRACC